MASPRPSATPLHQRRGDGADATARNWLLLLFAAITAFAFILTSPGIDRAGAQQAIEVVSNEARNDFPTGVTFTIAFRSDAPVERARLRYELAPDGTGASAIAPCSGSPVASCSLTLTSGRGIFVIPGAEITYHWEIEDEAGNEIETPEQLYVHEDLRFDFRTITSSNVTVYFHPGTEAEAPDVLQAAVESLQRVGELEETTVDFPVKVFLYATSQEMQPAIAPGGGRGVQILGEVVYSDTAMVSADVATLDITRHEIAHIVTREATKGPFDIPGWLNEGISVFAQRQPLSGHEGSLEAAIRGDRVLTMAELNSSSTGGVASTVGLYYGQAGSIVRFLVDAYGEAQFAELLRTVRSGSTLDSAFETVYGLDAFGVENAWRESVGLGARTAAPTPTPAPTEEVRGQPTSASGDGDPPPGAADSDDDGSGNSVLAIGLIAALGGAAIATGWVTFSVARRRI